MKGNITTADRRPRTVERRMAICNCGMQMELITIFQKGKKPEEIWMCPKCHEPELRIWRK